LVPQLNDEAWDDLEKRLILKYYKKGDYINKAGEIINAVSFIEKGIARVYETVDEKEVIGYFFVENEFVAEYESFIMQKPAKCFIDVLEDSSVWELSYTDVQELYSKHHLLERFGRIISEYLFIELSDRNSELTTLSPEERYLKLITQKIPLPPLLFVSLLIILTLTPPPPQQPSH
jgi:signal-transduction protein with cAMP-binding, CBS, and nucleotidyltransferase domain